MIGVRGVLGIVGGVHDRHPSGAFLREQGRDPLLGLGVQSRGGFVQQQQVRLLGEPLSQEDPLALARGPEGEGLLLGTDGALHVIDMENAEIAESFPVVDAWEEPLEWQEARPSVFVRGDTAYVNDPTTSRILAVDLESGEITAEADLPRPANEMTGI